MKPRFPNRGSAKITKRKFDPQTLAAAVLAVAGVGFLELAGSQQFVIGRPGVGGCNFLFSIHGPSEMSESGGFQPILFGIGRLSWTKDRIKIDSLANFSCLAQASQPQVIWSP